MLLFISNRWFDSPNQKGKENRLENPYRYRNFYRI